MVVRRKTKLRVGKGRYFEQVPLPLRKRGRRIIAEGKSKSRGHTTAPLRDGTLSQSSQIWQVGEYA